MTDFTIRPATAEDSDALARIHISGWQSTYGGIVPQDYLDSLSVDERAAQWRGWFVEGFNALIAIHPDTGPCGFVSFGRLKTPVPGQSLIRPLYAAEIYAIYLLPDVWRQGLGRQLMAAAAKALKEMKHKSLCLWVIEQNSRATGFYKKLGGERVGKKDIEVGGKTLRELAFAWRDTKTLIEG